MVKQSYHKKRALGYKNQKSSFFKGAALFHSPIPVWQAAETVKNPRCPAMGSGGF